MLITVNRGTAWLGRAHIACTAQGGTIDTLSLTFPFPPLFILGTAAAAPSCLISFDCSAKCKIKIQRMLNALTLARDS